MRLASASSAKNIDALAAAEWGLDSPALVEAAGRACRKALLGSAFPGTAFTGTAIRKLRDTRIVALLGGGNNAADALVMLRALALSDEADPLLFTLVFARPPRRENSPLSSALTTLEKLGSAVLGWDGPAGRAAEALDRAGLVIDGIAGTGLRGALSGEAAEMALAVTALAAAAAGAAAAGAAVAAGAVAAAGATAAGRRSSRSMFPPVFRTNGFPVSR